MRCHIKPQADIASAILIYPTMFDRLIARRHARIAISLKKTSSGFTGAIL